MNRTLISGLTRALAPYLALWLVCAALVCGAAIYTVAADHDRDRNTAQKDAANLSRLIQAQAMRTLDRIDRTLSLVRAFQERRIIGPSPRSLFETLRLGDDVGRRVTVFDRDGRFVTSTASEAAIAGVPVTERDYFRAARDGNSDALIIAAPMPGHVSGHTVLPAVERLTSATGEFDGIVIAALDPAHLIDVYRDIDLGDGEFVGVAQRNGRILATSAASEEAPGPLALPPTAGTGAAIAWPLLDGVSYLVAARAVPGTELVVFVARLESDIFAGNQRFVGAVVPLAGLSLLLLALPVGYAARRSLRVLREREALEVRARIDPLTQAYNRAALEDRLQPCLRALARDGESFALAFIDIDDFKALNDSRGHAEGDRALARIAGILQANVRKTDVVSRMGGDEFAVLLPSGAMAATRRVFQQVIEMLRMLVRNEGWPISFSIGVVTFGAPPQNVSEAISIADRVMYAVKQSTKDGICFASHDQHGLQLDSATDPVRVEPWSAAPSSSHAA